MHVKHNDTVVNDDADDNDVDDDDDKADTDDVKHRRKLWYRCYVTSLREFYIEFMWTRWAVCGRRVCVGGRLLFSVVFASVLTLIANIVQHPGSMVASTSSN